MELGFFMRVLICTIVRNRAEYLKTWHGQLELFSKDALERGITFTLSIYENDSVDDSAKILKDFDYSFAENCYLISENIKTKFYGSVKHGERVRLLADARNKCLDQVPALSTFDKVVFIEPDILSLLP